MEKIASTQKKRVIAKICEIERSVGNANYETWRLMKDMLEETDSKEIVFGTTEDVFSDPEKFLCVPCDPIDGIPQTWGAGPCPGYVYGLKLKNGSIKFMVVFSNGETAETDLNIDVFDALFLARQIANTLQP